MLASPRGQGRKGQGADFALRDLTVVIKQSVGKSRGSGQDACARRRSNFDGQCVQRRDVIYVECFRSGAADALARAAKGFEHCDGRVAATQRSEQARHFTRGVLIRAQRQDACACVHVWSQVVYSAAAE